MRVFIAITILITSSLLGVFTAYAKVNHIFPGYVKIIQPKPDSEIRVKAGLSEDNESDFNLLDPDSDFSGEENAKDSKLFLVMGTDVVYSGYGRKTTSLQGRTDSILLVKMSKDKIDLLSIPRDSRVMIPGHGYDKINAANVYGGPELVIETIEKWLNVHIDNYAMINTYGVVQLVDTFGGIDFNVPKRMYYQDRTGGLYINLYPGQQHLSGLQVHNYLRFRHDGMGDLNRVKRQQEIIKVMLKQILQASNILKIPSALGVINKNVSTDLSIRKILSLANQAVGIENIQDKISMNTLPGEGKMIKGGWYWVTDTEGTNKILKELDLSDSYLSVSSSDNKVNNRSLSSKNIAENSDSFEIYVSPERDDSQDLKPVN